MNLLLDDVTRVGDRTIRGRSHFLGALDPQRVPKPIGQMQQGALGSSGDAAEGYAANGFNVGIVSDKFVKI